VFVQYGANQPGYDLAVSDDRKTLLVSVKGSQTGGWILTSKKKSGTYAEALDIWTSKNSRYVFFFAQYQRVAVGNMPRAYLALGSEVSAHLRTGAWGQLALSLIEHKEPTRGKKKGQIQRVPESWRVTDQRVNYVFAAACVQSVAERTCLRDAA